MNTSKRISQYLKLVFFAYLIVPFSCKKSCSDSCCGEKFEQRYTKIASLSLNTGSIDSNRKFQFVSSNSYANAALQLTINEVEYVYNKSKFNLSFMNSAYACDLPSTSPTQKISSIKIYSNQKIYNDNDVYEPGDDLSSLFVIVGIKNNKTIEEIIENSLLYHFGQPSDYLLLKLIHQVTIPENELTIEVSLDDEASFALSTDQFVIH